MSETATEKMVWITRMFDAPRELVFKAWATSQHMERWYAPHGCKVIFPRYEFHQGGVFHSCIHTPEGYDCWCRGEFLEIKAPEKLTYTLSRADAQGNFVTPLEMGMHPDWPEQTIVTVTFEDVEGKTRLTLHQTVNEDLAKQTGAHPSWLQMLDRLAEEVASAS